MSRNGDIKLDRCGCCEQELPKLQVANRAGLSAISYRIGTYGTFFQRMLARLPVQQIPDGDNQGARPLLALTTRERSDPAIALLDAAAVMADVLTFYQERIANEGFLRTATERRSVLQLARAIGYELNPGVAASTFLAFTVEEAEGAPRRATVPKGTQVRSVPAQGAMPQTFETMEEIETRAEWNVLRPRLTRPQALAIIKSGNFGLTQDELVLIDTLGSLNPDDPDVLVIARANFGQLYLLDDVPLPAETDAVVLVQKVRQIYLEGTETTLKSGDRVLFVGKSNIETADPVTYTPLVHAVTREDELNRVRIDLDLPQNLPAPPAFFTPTFQVAQVSATPVSFSGTTVQTSIVGRALHQRDFQTFLAINRWDAVNVLNFVSAPSPPKLSPPDRGLFCFKERLGFFGHNAPQYDSLPDDTHAEGPKLKGSPYPRDWDANGWEIWKDPKKPTSETNLYYDDAGAYLERSIPGILPESWVIFEVPGVPPVVLRVREAKETSIVGFSLSAKATGLELAKPDGTPLGDNTTDKSPSLKVRETTAFARSEPLVLTELPIDYPLQELVPQPDGTTAIKGAASVMLDSMVLNLQIGQPLIISGEREDARGVTLHEAAIIADIIHSGGYTTLYFEKRLQHTYARKTVTINANVVRATHGETVTEVLGSGNQAEANQRFILKKPPLTYVSAPTATGSESTLQIRANDVLWEEASSLYSLKHDSEKYIVRIDDDGSTSVTFGDGERGERLPTGVENVTATYRSGIGPEGEVEPGSLMLMQNRPLGIRGVTNPVKASGAEAPESLDKARVNAPHTVKTLERIVSLRDFEDFARTFAGIGKASAVALWDGEKRIVHVTVASAAGDVVESSSDLYKNLVRAIGLMSDPVQQVRVDSFQLFLFNIEATLKIDPRHTPEIVIDAGRQALIDHFQFEKRNFGQPVTAAEIITILQEIPGVVAVDLDNLYKFAPDETPIVGPSAVLRAEIAGWNEAGNEILPAQLLLLNLAGIQLMPMEENT